MSIETYSHVIQDILDLEAKKKTFDSKQDELVWRMGFLIGMLSQIADNDFTIGYLLDHKLETLTGHKKKK